MKNIYRLVLLLIIFPSLFLNVYSQDKPLELSIGSIKTDLKNEAVNFGIRYIKSLDSLFKEQDILLAGKKSLFQATPEFTVLSGTDDAFSSINIKVKGLLMFFETTTIDGIITPCTECIMHTLPVSIGVETNNKFNSINGVFEIGYVPWYQAARVKKASNWIKKTKAGIFIQTGYKFKVDDTGDLAIGGQIDESEEELNSGILRSKGSFVIDTKNLFEINGVGFGLIGSADGWYDFLNSEIYYSIDGKARFYLTEKQDKYFDIEYQKGSGAPNFNQGDQYGMGLTIMF